VQVQRVKLTNDERILEIKPFVPLESESSCCLEQPYDVLPAPQTVGDDSF
jgi:hypothetical protein